MLVRAACSGLCASHTCGPDLAGRPWGRPARGQPWVQGAIWNNQKLPPLSPSFQELPLRSSPSPANSTAGTIDSDGWDAGFADISSTVPLPVSDRCFGHLQPTLLQRAKPSNFLLDRKKTDKLKKKKKRKRRDSDAPGKEGYMGGLLQLEAADPYAETPTSPTLQDSPQAPGDPCSGWDSDTPSSGSCAAVSPDQVKEIKTEGKRTIVRQGKQVVFRDEDSTGNDEDIMVDSGALAPKDCGPRAGGQRAGGERGLGAAWVREEGAGRWT